MTTERLYEFLILSQTLNFSSAAKILYITQSVLSKHIQSMEKELNTTLFIRSTHDVSLTTAGRFLAQEAAPLLAQCNHALNLIQIETIPTKGVIKIACALELSYASHIQVFIGRFMERYPDINVTVEICCNGTPESLINNYNFVFTPCLFQNLSDEISSILLETHGTYVALYPSHPLLSKSLLNVRELESETIIVPFLNELFGPYSQNWQLVKRMNHDYVNCIPASNLSSALFLVSIGKGIAIIPKYVRNLLPNNIFMVGLSNKDCCFNEYVYFNKSDMNPVAGLFYKELCEIGNLL